MKLKIVSSLIAISMAMTSFVGVVSAANVTATNPAYVLTTAGELTDWTGYEELKTDFDWSEYEAEFNADYKTYIIDVKLTGAEYSTTVTGSKTKKLAGTSIIGAKINATFDTEASYEDDYVYGIASALASYTPNITASGIQANYTSTSALSPNKAAGSKTVTAADSSDAVYQLIVTVDASKPVTLSVDGEVYFDDFTDDKPGSGTASKVVAAAGKITLPPVSGPVVSGTTTAVTKEVDNVKGKVWNDVKIENLAESDTDWVVKFTDGDDSVTYDLDLAGNETQGTLSFAVILKSLTRSLANVVMEILPGTAN